MAFITIDENVCKGCGLCALNCPKKIIEMRTDKANKSGYYPAQCVDSSKCIGCALCATMCPDCAIEVDK